MTVNCHSCHKPFVGYKELALHIAGSKKGHRNGKKWAAKYLMNINFLNSKKDFGERVPLTEEQKEAKVSAIRELSGETEGVLCVCPHCKQGHRETLPVEFTQSVDAWKGKLGNLVVMCGNCRS